MKKNLALLALVLLVAFSIFFGPDLYYSLRFPAVFEIAEEPINVFRNPWREKTDKREFLFTDRQNKSITLDPVVSLDVSGKVGFAESYSIGKSQYGLGDILALDLGLVWGDLAKENYFSLLNFSRESIYVSLSYDSPVIEKELEPDYISSHFYSLNLIPANDNLDLALKKVGKRDLVRIKGMVVDIRTADNIAIKSSDPGESAENQSQFVYVEEVQVENKVYR